MKKILIITAIVFSNTVYSQFSEQKLLAGETVEPYSVISADIDGDGDLDVITASVGEYAGDVKKVAWYKNLDGNGTFGSQTIIGIPSGEPRCLNSGDVDGDGDIDIIAGIQSSNNVIWYENLNGAGSFSSEKVIGTGFYGAFNICTGDMDGDSDLDVVAACYNYDKIAWFENISGTGTFSSAQIIASPIDGPNQVKLFDMDNDGDIDVLAAIRNAHKLIWYENIDGTGLFSTSHIVDNLLLNASTVNMFDMDGDSDLDIFASTYSSDPFVWYEHLDSLGTYGPRQILAESVFGSSSISVCDDNNDGDLDIFLGISNGILYLEYNSDSMYYEEPTMIPSSNSVWSLSTPDLDGNGFPDLLFLSQDNNTVAWIRNDGAGGFSNQVDLSNYRHGAWITKTFDFDADGDQDIIANSVEELRWFEHFDGQGTFTTNKRIGGLSNWSKCLDIGDIDSDGDIDILCEVGYKTSWYKNIDGMGNYMFGNQITTDFYSPYQALLFDLNNDNKLDVLGAITQEDKVVWYRSTDGNGHFSPQNVITTLADGVRFATASDLDGDNDLDVISASPLDNKIAWYENTDGVGTFGPQNIISSTAAGVAFVYLCDIDGDSDMDLFATSNYSGSDGVLFWFENTDGLGTFGEQNIISTNAVNCGYISSGDIDFDGDIDIVSCTEDSDAAWYENLDGSGSFGAPNVLNTTNFTNYSVLLTDIDGDWDLDIIVGSEEDEVSWFENFLYGGPGTISGNIFFDENNNGSLDNYESTIPYIQTQLFPEYLGSFSNSTGNYWFAVDYGNYEIMCDSVDHWNLTTGSYSMDTSVSVTNQIIDNINFGFYPSEIVTDIEVSMVCNSANCGTEVPLWLNILNLGTTNPNMVVELILDDSITYISADVLPDSITGQKIYWSVDSLCYFCSEEILITVRTPDFNSMGDIITSITNVYSSDISGTNIFTEELSDMVTCSYDPNCKNANPTGTGESFYISKDEPLEYTIHFQNTGNDTAINILIHDQLDINLDISELEYISSSHPVEMFIQENRMLAFQFDNIMLPDSNVNFIESQGYVSFRIKIDENVMPATQIINSAEIFFDNNPAVLTNQVWHTIECYPYMEIPQINHVLDYLFVESQDSLNWFFNDTLITSFLNDTIYPLDTGNYHVVIYDSLGCSFITDNFYLTCINLPAIPIISLTDSVLFTNNSDSIQWYINDTAIISANDSSYIPSENGIYSVLVMNSSGCSSVSDEYVLDCYFLPTAPEISQNGDSLIVVTDYPVQWFYNGLLIEGAENSVYIPVESGDYYAMVFAEDGCFSISNSIYYDATIVNYNSAAFIKAYPNPFENNTLLVFSDEVFINCDLILYDMSGVEKLRYSNISTNQIIINGESLDPGTYICKFHSNKDNNVKGTIKLIVK